MSIEKMLHHDPRVTGNEFGNKKMSYHTGKRALTMGEGKLPLRAKGAGVYPIEFCPKSPIRPGIEGGNKARHHKHHGKEY